MEASNHTDRAQMLQGPQINTFPDQAHAIY